MNVDRAGLYEEVFTLLQQVNAHLLGRTLSSVDGGHVATAIHRVLLYYAATKAAETTTAQFWQSAVQLSQLLDELDAQLEIVEAASADSSFGKGHHGLA